MNKYFYDFLWSLIKTISAKQKYIINARNYYKKIYFFSLQSIRMSGKSINVDDKKIKKSDFYNNKTKYLIQMIMLTKY